MVYIPWSLVKLTGDLPGVSAVERLQPELPLLGGMDYTLSLSASRQTRTYLVSEPSPPVSMRRQGLGCGLPNPETL